MAHYSQLSTDQVTEILDQYAVGDLSNFKVLSGGSENTNYLVTTTNAKFVLTICEQKTFPETDDLAKLLQHLAQHQFFTTQIIPNNSKEFVTAFNNKPALLKTFIEGSIIEDLPNNTLQSLGRQLAQLHNIPPPAALPLQVTYGKETFVGVEEYAKNSDFQHWLYDIRAQVLALANECLPKALIHSDIFFDNVVISPDSTTATIMDFEEAAYYYRIFDIGMMLVGICGESSQLNLEKSKAVLQGYQEVICLQEEEIKALQTFSAYAAAGTGFWRHKQYHYVMPDSAMANHYQAMTSLADQILAIEESDFLGIFNTA